MSMSFVGHAPTVSITPATELVRIPCPYCKLGGCLLPMQKGGLEKLRIEGVRDPRKCDTCGKYFLLTIRVVVEGAKIQGEN